MIYRNRSARCVHGMCLESVGCEECGIKPDPKARTALRRCSSPRQRSGVPDGYRRADGRRGLEGNSNARSRY